MMMEFEILKRLILSWHFKTPHFVQGEGFEG